MTKKFTIPPLVRVEEDGLAIIWPCEPRIAKGLYERGYLAGIDAVIAALREPDEGIRLRVPLRTNTLRALADELERRKP